MNGLDIVLAGLAIAGLLKGWADGLLRQIVSLIAFGAAIYLCSEGAEALHGYLLQKEWMAEQTVTLVSYVLAFVFIAGIILLSGWVIHKLVSVTPLSLPNRLAGALFGLVITLFLISLTLNMLEGLDGRSQLISYETKMESQFYFHVKKFASSLYSAEWFFWINH
ncbi:MAG: CvpA family protein [Tannerella sp.]|jgi:membrane protein required for colicin V production|nr:CvpA family protein [Tannerella sp.]